MTTDHTVNLAHSNNVKMYQALCTTEGLAFSPLARDMFGGWHKDTLAVISRLGTQQARNLNKEPEDMITGSLKMESELARSLIWIVGMSSYVFGPDIVE